MPLRGWADILYRTWMDIGRKDLSLVAAGVTYYLLLALFPALAALVSVYGLVENPAGMTKDIQSLSGILPPSIVTLTGDELRQLISKSSGSLSLGAVLGFAIALFSSMRGMTGMMEALTIAYGQQERRGYIRFYATALLLTVLIVASGLVALMLVAGLPALLSGTGVRSPARWISLVVEWPLLTVFVAGVVSAIYRYGPAGSKPQWRWASLGIITATFLWLIGSILFSVYVYNFSSYDTMYGSLGLPLVLLTWVWLSVFVVLFGAEINGEVERRTQRGTTAAPVADEQSGN
jgi:membrane protein